MRLNALESYKLAPSVTISLLAIPLSPTVYIYKQHHDNLPSAELILMIVSDDGEVLAINQNYI